MTENLTICTSTESFDSVGLHLELAILSRKFTVVEYFNLFCEEFSLSLQDLHFHQVMDIMLQKQVIY